MRTTDVAGFLSTALITIFSNAVIAIAVGCFFYVVAYYRPRVAGWLESGHLGRAVSPGAGD
jgi:hypothetical protein